MKLIKIYGERNTNTNYVSKLIELNLDIVEISGIVPSSIMKVQKILPGNELIRDVYFQLTYEKNLGWKHRKVELSNFHSNIIFLTITKNPYSWLLSLYRKPYHQYFSRKDISSFEQFLERPWKTVIRDNIEKKFVSPIELWNIKNGSYLKLPSENTINFTTEGIFENPETIINKISKQYSIKRKSDKFINYERSTKDKSKDFFYYRDYYLSEKWREELSDKAISIINKSIDKNLMSYFNYEIIS